MPDARNAPADKIIGRSLIVAETVAQELRDKLVDILAESNTYNQARILEECRAVLAEYEPLMAENYLISDLAAWVSGFDTVAGKTPEQVLRELAFLNGGKPPMQPPRFWFPPVAGGEDGEPIIRFPLIEKAVDDLVDRRILTRARYDQLSDEAKQRAFTVAGQSSEATIEKIRDVLAENVREGTSLRGFRRRLREEIDTSEIGPAHLETIYRTNVQTAFSAGRDELTSNPIVSEVFPYREFIPIHDGRVGDADLALGSLGLNGTGIYRADDPFWDSWTPPIHYNCRCGTNEHTIESAARHGVKEAQRWLRTGEPPAVPEYRYDKIPFTPQPGFGRRARWEAFA